MNRSSSTRLAAALAFAGLLAPLAAGAQAERPGYFPADAERGRTLAAVCLPCHGVAAMPSTTEPSFHVPLLAGQRGEALFAALQDYRSGKRQSPIMAALVENLAVQDMRDLAAYLSASGPYVPETVGAGSWAHGKVHRDCTICHGESGMGVMAGVPVLTGQHEDYLVHALEAYRNGERAESTMAAVAQALSPDEIGLLAAYFAKQSHLKPNTNDAGLADARDAGLADASEAGLTDSSEANLTDANEVAAAIVMVEIPGGDFVMGTEPPVGFQNGYPPHPVHVPSFRLGATEITFEQYDAFARATGRALPPDERWGRGLRPAIHVDGSDVHAFIDWLNAATGRRLRLPSEAEWEYAARAGTASVYPWGDRVDHARVNNSVDSGPDRWAYTAPVAQFPPNAFGLHDMLGNVWERVEDCRHPTYDGAPVDGSAWLDDPCESRVVRGGSWGSTSRGVQPAARGAASESFESMDLGFRLAEDSAPPIQER